MQIADELVECVKAGAGEDWSLNADLAKALGWTLQACRAQGMHHAMCVWVDPDGRIASALPNFTGEFDAALRVLPTDAYVKHLIYWSEPPSVCRAAIGFKGGATFFGDIDHPTGIDPATMCRAIILAGLAARRATETAAQEAAE